MSTCHLIHLPNKLGVILLTYTALIALHIGRLFTRALEEFRQPHQILEPEVGASRRNRHKRILRRQARPRRWKRGDFSALIVEINAILTPVVAIRHNFKFTPREGVIGMGYSETSLRTASLRCS
jgi:hypothetical protein